MISTNSKRLKSTRRICGAIRRWVGDYIHQASVRPRFLALVAKLFYWKWCIRKISPAQKIIGIHLIEHMGDIVACEPIIRCLRQRDPDAFLVWFVREQYSELLRHNPEIDLVLTVSCLTEGILIRGVPVFDEFVDLHINGKECPCCRIKLVNSGNPEITINTFLSYGGLLQIFCECAGLPRLHDHPRIHIPDATVLRVDSLNLPENFVVIHCTANDENRNWATEFWQVLVRQLTEQMGLYVIEVGLNPIVRSDSPNYYNVCGQVSIMEMAEIINRANVFLGVESGPAHIANAVKTPGVILLGPIYSFKSYLPYTGMYADSSRTQHVYSEHGIKHITVQEVCDSLTHQLSTSHRNDAKNY